MSSQPHPRKTFIAGNWKSNGDRAFVNKHCMFWTGVRTDKNTQLSIAAPSSYLLKCKTFLADIFNISSQNISQFDDGPYTGEVSAKQIKDLGIDWTIIGHSERRKYFFEDDNIIGKKIEQAIKYKLNFILCIGDDKDAKEIILLIILILLLFNIIIKYIKRQLNIAFEKIKGNWDDVVIAYEPITENGNGISKEKIQEMHEFIRKEIKEKMGEEISNKIRIIYGGNVDEKNCNELILLKDVDGFLVSEPSIKSTFINIIESAKRKK